MRIFQTSRKMTSQVGVDFSKSSFLPHFLNKSFASSVVKPWDGLKSNLDGGSLSSPTDLRAISVEILLICLLMTIETSASAMLARLLPAVSCIASVLRGSWGVLKKGIKHFSLVETTQLIMIKTVRLMLDHNDPSPNRARQITRSRNIAPCAAARRARGSETRKGDSGPRSRNRARRSGMMVKATR